MYYISFPIKRSPGVPLGEKLKALRELRGWSQRELARQSGVRQTLISELESGRKEDTTGSNLRKLAETLHVSVDYLVGKHNDPNRSPAEGCHLEGAAPLPVTTISEEIIANGEHSISP
jgi:transcriptional regulator with XRE-family HTH domain